jgi:Zn finger protein HypA/HybF involved in hydrogenase expression
MRKKKYKKLVEELQSEVSSLKEQLKPLIERQLLQEQYVVSLKYGKRVIECPNCKEETYVKVHESIAPRCYSCSHPRPIQGFIDTWMGKSE